MKKIIVTIALACMAVLLLAGCSGGETPAAAWADSETLVYTVTDTKSEATLGSMKMVTERNPSDKTLNGKEYTADGRVTIEKKTDKVHSVIQILMNRYSVVATYVQFTDLTDEKNNYVLESYHSGKNYFYSLNGGEQKKLKTGASGYTDSDFVYHYIRSYPLASPPSALKIADPFSDSVLGLSCTYIGTSKLNVPYPTGVKEVECSAIAVSLSEEPRGEAITVLYTPDSSDYYVQGLSISPSKKIPVKILEHDVTYTITSVEVR